MSGNMRGNAFNSDYWPYFLGHGIVALTTEQHILPGRFAKPLDKNIFHVHGEGVFANRPCVVLRSATWRHGNVGFDELWVDLGRDSAVLREVAYVNDKIGSDIQVNYQQTRAGWLPQDWTASVTYLNDVIFSIDRMHVDELEIDPIVKDADFRLVMEPGMVVRQISVPNSPDQITNPKPNPNHPLFQVTQGGSLQPVNGPEPRSLWFLYLCWASIVLMGVSIPGIFWWQSRKHKPAQ